MLYPMSSLTIGRGGDIAGDLFDDDILSVSFTIAVRTLLHLFVCVLLLGLAELSTALADPFTGGYLPLEDMARTTVRDVARARREAPLRRLASPPTHPDPSAHPTRPPPQRSCSS